MAKSPIIDDAVTLKAEIDAFLERWDMTETAFGCMALNNGHFYRRLREGKDIYTSTAARVRKAMADYEAEHKKPARRRAEKVDS